MVYISGYIQHQAGATDADDSYYYYEHYGLYLKNINRRGLIIPGDVIVQWVIYCYIFFVNARNKVCRQFLTKCFLIISHKFILLQNSISMQHAHILANIFLKNMALISTPKSYRESSLKVLKLKQTIKK